MRTLTTTWLAFALLAAPLYAVPTSDRCPGEGPKPLAEVPWDNQAAINLSTAAPVAEFVMDEPRQQLIFRDVNHQVFRRNLTATGTVIPAAPRLGTPLGNVFDPAARYLTAENYPFYFDMVTASGWFGFNTPVTRSKPLFWGNGDLYGMEAPSSENATGEIHLYRYRPGSWLTWRVCRNLWTSGEQFALAEGGRYPYLSLYKRITSDKGHGILLYRVNVETCVMDTPALMFDKLPGPATKVQVVTKPYGAAIHVEEPTKKVLWYRDGACRYIDVEGADVSIPNPDLPIFAVRDTLKLMVLDPEREQYTTLRASLPATSVRERDIAITADGKALIVAPVDLEGRRRLLRIDLPSAMR